MQYAPGNNEMMVYMRKQLSTMRTIALVCFVMLVALIVAILAVVPSLNSTVGNLEKVADELAQADFAAMVQEIETLIDQSQTVVQTALEKIDSIDVEGMNNAISELNTAIEDLNRVTGALGRLFG